MQTEEEMQESRYLFGSAGDEMYGIKRSAEEAELMDPSAFGNIMDHHPHHHHPHHHNPHHHHLTGQPQADSSPPQVDNNNKQQQQQQSVPQKKAPPPNGKKTKGRVKIKMEFIDNKLRRYTTFSKRKTGIMKKAYELSTLTGTQVMLLVASETGHVYTFATRKLQPMITSEAGKALIQTCLNSPDPPPSGGGQHDQRMSATGFEETELTYTINDDEQKVRQMMGYASSPLPPSPSPHPHPHQHPPHPHHPHAHLLGAGAPGPSHAPYPTHTSPGPTLPPHTHPQHSVYVPHMPPSPHMVHPNLQR